LQAGRQTRFESSDDFTVQRSKPIKKPATIQDVARAARVSTATVSRALSRPERVSDATRKAVEDAVRDTGFRLNRAAQNLRMQRAGAVLAMVHNIGKPFNSEILAGLAEGFHGTDYALLLTDTEDNPLVDDALATISALCSCANGSKERIFPPLLWTTQTVHGWLCSIYTRLGTAGSRMSRGRLAMC
jgi:hypothetical protein